MQQTIRFGIPFVPYCTMNNYREFLFGEKHVTRVIDEYVLIFMIENVLYFTEEGKEVEVRPGQWYVQRPGLRQEGILPCPAPRYFYIHFKVSGGISAGDLGAKKDDGAVIIMPIRGEYPVRSFMPLFDKMNSLSPVLPYDNFEMQTVFHTIINYLFDLGRKAKSESSVLADSVIGYVNDNYTVMEGNGILQNVFNYSDDHITNTVKKRYGITPWQYVIKLRLERAMDLLQNTNYPVEYIAETVGYNDLSVFYKAFKKGLSVSPRQWRLNSRNIKKV